MGNSMWCQQNCPKFMCKQSSKESALRTKYRKYLKYSEFKDICIQTIERNFSEELQLQKEQILRKSMLHTSHYQANSLNNSFYNDQFVNVKYNPTHINASTHSQLSGSISAMPIEQKQKYIMNLVKESYLFIDLTDCLQDSNTISYERCIKYELLKNDQSLNASFIKDTSALERLQNCLRHYDPEMISELQNYVKFCRKVNHDFVIQNQRFMGKLCLNLQSQIIRKYSSKQFRQNNLILLELVQDIRNIIKILVITIQTFYQISVNPQDDNYYFQTSSNFDFYNEMNIYTMITSLIFQNQQFDQFIINKIKQCFLQRFKLYKRESQYTASMFVTDFIGLNSKRKFKQEASRTELSTLIQCSKQQYSDIHIFIRSRKILSKIFQKSIPLFKLKLVYELSKQMYKQLQELKGILLKKYNIEVANVFTRQTDLLIIKWLLKSYKGEIQAYSAHLLFTYFFIHQNYKIDKKGSYLTTFIQQIERIVQWEHCN